MPNPGQGVNPSQPVSATNPPVFSPVTIPASTAGPGADVNILKQPGFQNQSAANLQGDLVRPPPSSINGPSTAASETAKILADAKAQEALSSFGAAGQRAVNETLQTFKQQELPAGPKIIGYESGFTPSGTRYQTPIYDTSPVSVKGTVDNLKPDVTEALAGFKPVDLSTILPSSIPEKVQPSSPIKSLTPPIITGIDTSKFASNIIDQASKAKANSIYIFDSSGKQIDNIPVKDAQAVLKPTLDVATSLDSNIKVGFSPPRTSDQRALDIANAQQLVNTITTAKRSGSPIEITDTQGNIIKSFTTISDRTHHDILQTLENNPDAVVRFTPPNTYAYNPKTNTAQPLFNQPESPLGEFLKGTEATRLNLFNTFGDLGKFIISGGQAKQTPQLETPLGLTLGGLVAGIKNPSETNQAFSTASRLVKERPAYSLGSLAEEIGIQASTLGIGKALDLANVGRIRVIPPTETEPIITPTKPSGSADIGLGLNKPSESSKVQKVFNEQAQFLPKPESVIIKAPAIVKPIIPFTNEEIPLGKGLGQIVPSKGGTEIPNTFKSSPPAKPSPPPIEGKEVKSSSGLSQILKELEQKPQEEKAATFKEYPIPLGEGEGKVIQIETPKIQIKPVPELTSKAQENTQDYLNQLAKRISSRQFTIDETTGQLISTKTKQAQESQTVKPVSSLTEIKPTLIEKTMIDFTKPIKTKQGPVLIQSDILKQKTKMGEPTKIKIPTIQVPTTTTKTTTIQKTTNPKPSPQISLNTPIPVTTTPPPPPEITTPPPPTTPPSTPPPPRIVIPTFYFPNPTSGLLSPDKKPRKRVRNAFAIYSVNPNIIGSIAQAGVPELSVSRSSAVLGRVNLELERATRKAGYKTGLDGILDNPFGGSKPKKGKKR